MITEWRKSIYRLISVFMLMLLALLLNIQPQASEGESSDPAGTNRAMELTGDVTAIMSRGVVLESNGRELSEREARILEATGHVTVRRDGYMADVRSLGGDCNHDSGASTGHASSSSTGSGSGSGSGSASANRLRFDIELRVTMVGGISRNGMRTPYSSLAFLASEENFSNYFGDRLNSGTLAQAVTRAAADPVFAGDRQLALEHVLRHRLSMANPSERDSLLRQAGRMMSFDDQVAFVAKLGKDLGDRYDHSRADLAASATEIPSCDAMLSNLGNNADIGVCRDIHMCMAHVLQKMGNVGNVYGLSYATPGNYHVSLVASDPNNPSRVHNINYNSVNVADDRTGSAALAQDHDIPDVGISYRLWKPDGNGGGTMVASLPSQMGLVLNEVTGGINTRDFDPNITQDYNLISAGPGYGPFGIRAFAAELANGDKVLGVATNVRWGDRPSERSRIVYGVDGLDHDGSIGIAFAHREMIRPSGGEPTNLDVNMIYLNFQQRVGLPIHIDRVTVTPELGLIIQGTGIEGGFPDERGWTGDGNVTLSGSVRADYVSTDERTHLSAAVGTQATLGLQDIRGLFGSDAIVVFNHTYTRLALEQQLSETARLNAALLYTFREYGDTLTTSAGVSVDSAIGTTSLTAGITNPVTRTNGFAPGGSNPTINLGLSQSVIVDRSTHSTIDFTTTYTQQLDTGLFMVNSGVGFHF